MPTPDSQPNASQITNAVVIGRIVAASIDAPNSPIANSSDASSPATGSRAAAAWPAVATSTPATPRVEATATTMNRATAFDQTAPPIASARSSDSSSSSMPFSATALWR